MLYSSHLITSIKYYNEFDHSAVVARARGVLTTQGEGHSPRKCTPLLGSGLHNLTIFICLSAYLPDLPPFNPPFLSSTSF